MAEQLQLADQRDPRLVAALQAEGEHRADAARTESLRQRMIPVGRQARVVDPTDPLVARQMLGDGERVVAMPAHPQRQRLDPVEDQEGVERRQRRPEVAQAEHAAGDGEAEIAEGLGEHHAVVFRPRRREHGIARVAEPIERAAIDDDAAHRIAVAAEELRRGMDDDVGAVLGGAHQVGRRQRVVDDQRQRASRAILAIASTSQTTPPGLAIDSMKIARVLSVMAALKLSGSSGFAHLTRQS